MERGEIRRRDAQPAMDGPHQPVRAHVYIQRAAMHEILASLHARSEHPLRERPRLRERHQADPRDDGH